MRLPDVMRATPFARLREKFEIQPSPAEEEAQCTYHPLVAGTVRARNQSCYFHQCDVTQVSCCGDHGNARTGNAYPAAGDSSMF